MKRATATRPIRLAPIQPGQRCAVSIEVARVITAAIADGRLKPGDRLPSERELARMLAVSRSSLRDALKVLTGMGVVRVRRNYGVFVAAPEEPQVAGSRPAPLPTADRPAIELFEIRRVLETQACAWAAKRATLEQLRRIDHAYARFSAKATEDSLDPEQANAFDIEIHALIAQATGNSLLAQMVTDLRQAAEKVRGWRDALQPDRIAANVADLGLIVDALRRGDAETARHAMLEHLIRGETATLQLRRTQRAQPGAAPSAKAQR